MKLKNKIAFIASQSTSVKVFLAPHLRLLNSFFELLVITNSEDDVSIRELGLNLDLQHAKIERQISLVADLCALWQLFVRLRNQRPIAVHTVTPKSGLLGMCAAYLAGVPIRVHTFTGQVWQTRRGLMRWLLKTADRCIVYMATDILVDSPSQRRFLISEGIVSVKSSVVLGAGSICGVDTKRFSPNQKARREVRTIMNSSTNSLVCLYLGRLNRDKGVLDLAAAFAQVASKYPSAELWLVGPDEGHMFTQMELLLGGCIEKVRRFGYTNEPERFMQAADLFCLPSYREGFGSSVIEAAACGVPAFTSRIYGLTDAVIEGKTGWMHEMGNVQDLASKLELLLQDPIELVRRGDAARSYVEHVFEQSLITTAMLEFYRAKLAKLNIQ